MESFGNVLDNVSSIIYLLRFRRYSDQDCTFVGSDIINHQLKVH